VLSQGRGRGVEEMSTGAGLTFFKKAEKREERDMNLIQDFRGRNQGE